MVSHVDGADGDSSRSRWGSEINDTSHLELTRQQRVVKVMMQILSTSKASDRQKLPPNSARPSGFQTSSTRVDTYAEA